MALTMSNVENAPLNTEEHSTNMAMFSLGWNAETIFGTKNCLGCKTTLSLGSMKKGYLQEIAASSEIHLTDVIATKKAGKNLQGNILMDSKDGF